VTIFIPETAIHALHSVHQEQRAIPHLGRGLVAMEAENSFPIGASVIDPGGTSYRIMSVLGDGAFGRVYEVQDSASNAYALKIIASNPQFSAESVHFLKLIHSFSFQNRFCLLLELLDVDLYIALTQLNNHGFRLLMVQNITRQFSKASSFWRGVV
jgi:serine/threonine protein kinase